MPSEPDTIIYKTVGDCEIRADVYRQPGAGNPAVLFLHGGMLMAGSRADVRLEQYERYLQAGFTLVSADYRLAPETKLPAILTDIQAAYAWMRGPEGQAAGIDPNRIAVVGGSAGGYLTLLAGHRFNPRPRALAAFYGYSDIDGDWYSRPDPYYSQQPAVTREQAFEVIGSQELSVPASTNQRGRFYLYCRQNGLWPNEVVGIDPHRDPAAFDQFTPLRNVTADYPPTILIHGALDTDVPHEQSAQMARELARRGVEHEFISLPDHGHAFEFNEQIMQEPLIIGVFDRTMAFLKEHTAA